MSPQLRTNVRRVGCAVAACGAVDEAMRAVLSDTIARIFKDHG